MKLDSYKDLFSHHPFDNSQNCSKHISETKVSFPVVMFLCFYLKTDLWLDCSAVCVLTCFCQSVCKTKIFGGLSGSCVL